MTFLKHYSRLSKIKTQCAITLIELLVIIAIIGVLSTLASSWYSGYIETARVNTAISQISALSLLIDDYILENGEPPFSLAEVSNSDLIDPWGNPYEYLKLDLNNDDYAKNSIWQMGGGFMAFSMVSLNILSSSGKSDRENDKNERENAREDRKNDRKGDNKDRGDNNGGGGNDGKSNGGGSNDGENNGGGSNDGESNGGSSNDGGSNGGGSNNADDNSNDANNNNKNSDNENSAQTKARKDYSMVPLNTDYDLYSRGKDGASEPALPATVSQDDVLRANNGGFIGLASTF